MPPSTAVQSRLSGARSSAAMANDAAALPEGVFSLLDTDLYKLTMQCCILKFFPDVAVTYSFTNRTPEKKLSRGAFKWLQTQVASTPSGRPAKDMAAWASRAG